MEDPFGQFGPLVLVAFSPRLSSVLNKPQISRCMAAARLLVGGGWGMVGQGKAPYPGQEQRAAAAALPQGPAASYPAPPALWGWWQSAQGM